MRKLLLITLFGPCLGQGCPGPATAPARVVENLVPQSTSIPGGLYTGSATWVSDGHATGNTLQPATQRRFCSSTIQACP